MKLQKHSCLVVLFLSSMAFSQEKLNPQLVLERPAFSAPENELLFFLSEDYFFNPNNYRGKVKQVQKISSQYKKGGRLTRSDTVTLTKTLYRKLKEISKNPVLDYIGVDSIAKKENKFELYHFDEFDANYFQQYTLTNNRITKCIDNTSLLIYTTNYTYNAKTRLIKSETEDDYGNKKIEIARYNKKGQLATKQSYENTDGIKVVTTNYTYHRDSLVKVAKKETVYFVPLEEEKPLENIDYTTYFDPETYITSNTLDFKYNAENKLEKVTEVVKAYSYSEAIPTVETRIFELTYAPNKLIVKATLPEKRNYEYLFDSHNNPKEINAYVIDDDKAWLNKKTLFTILYTNI